MTALEVNFWDLRARIEAVQWAIGQDLLRVGAKGHCRVGTWARDERDALRIRTSEPGASTELIYLDVPADELWRRIPEHDMEDPPIERSDVDAWFHVFQAPDAAEMGPQMCLADSEGGEFCVPMEHGEGPGARPFTITAARTTPDDPTCKARSHQSAWAPGNLPRPPPTS